MNMNEEQKVIVEKIKDGISTKEIAKMLSRDRKWVNNQITLMRSRGIDVPLLKDIKDSAPEENALDKKDAKKRKYVKRAPKGETKIEVETSEKQTELINKIKYMVEALAKQKEMINKLNYKLTMIKMILDSEAL